VITEVVYGFSSYLERILSQMYANIRSQMFFDSLRLVIDSKFPFKKPLSIMSKLFVPRGLRQKAVIPYVQTSFHT
jgi:hypothetical protein